MCRRIQEGFRATQRRRRLREKSDQLHRGHRCTLLSGGPQRLQKKSLICDGIVSSRRVWKFTYLPPNYKLNCSPGDVKLMRDCVQYRLSSQALDATILNTNIQKCEAVNRAYSLRNPKNITFARNFSSRIHSAAHEVNNGPGESITLQAASVGASIVPGSLVAQQLRSSQIFSANLK